MSVFNVTYEMMCESRERVNKAIKAVRHVYNPRARGRYIFKITSEMMRESRERVAKAVKEVKKYYFSQEV